MIVYHGANEVIKEPDLLHSRKNIDFGRGFYLTEDPEMARKWSAGRGVNKSDTLTDENLTKKEHIINRYELNTDGLKILQLDLSYEWLALVLKNRAPGKFDTDLYQIMRNVDDYDVIIGPTADDKMFDTINEFINGNYTPEQTMRYLNIADLPQQITLKNDKALLNLRFLDFEKLNPRETKHYISLSKIERGNALDKLAQITRIDAKKNIEQMIQSAAKENERSSMEQDRQEEEYEDR